MTSKRRKEKAPEHNGGLVTEAPPFVAERSVPTDFKPAPQLVSLVSPTSFEAEQYRILRHSVERRHLHDGIAVIAVTSAGGGDGKTTTAINLAGALAQAADQRVLLVEADLRRPALMAQVGMRPTDFGLAEAITDGSHRLEDLTVRVPGFNLWVLPAGRPMMNPYETLRSPRVAALMAEARNQYAYVIIDTPPVVPCPDYLLLEPLIDAVVLVVAADRTPREMMDAALDMLDKSKTLGIIFNGQGHQPDRYSYHYYSSARKSPAGRWPWSRWS
jgi:capsular exopolysaccharide synthesis family protein